MAARILNSVDPSKIERFGWQLVLYFIYPFWCRNMGMVNSWFLMSKQGHTSPHISRAQHGCDGPFSNFCVTSS